MTRSNTAGLPVIQKWHAACLLASRALRAIGDRPLEKMHIPDKVWQIRSTALKSQSLRVYVMAPSLSATAVKTAAQIFFSPSPQYGWEEIINGVLATYPDGGSERRDAVGTTSRAFHRIDKSPGAKGAKAAYDLFFREKQEIIRNDLSQVKSRHDLHQICEVWRARIVENLANVKPHLLESYNRTRKPIDLHIMNLVALAKEAVDLRERLVPMLFLPLDGEMFQKAFRIEELQKHGLSRRSKYGDVKTEAEYLSLQRIVEERSRDWSDELGMVVHPIYFDMMWRNRSGAQGGNIFTASRMRSV